MTRHGMAWQGDLARVVSITEGGAKALIQAVPRPDYTVKSKGVALHLLCVMLLCSMSFNESHDDDDENYLSDNTNDYITTIIPMKILTVI